MRGCFSYFLVIFSFLFAGAVSAQNYSVTLDHVDGADVSMDTLLPDIDITFYIRFTNPPEPNWANITCVENGFQVYSPDGAVWEPITWVPYRDFGQVPPVVIDYYPGWSVTIFDETTDMVPYSVTGSGADTIGLSGIVTYGTGLPPGFDDVVYTISTRVDASQSGKTLCLDSCWYRPNNEWVWCSDTADPGDPGPGDIFPTWDGPHCFTIGYNDFDGDGIANPDDNCPAVANPLQEDSDGDGDGDSCDVCIYDADNDGDGDGYCADDDNCPTVDNPDQGDIDYDGIGDLCDADTVGFDVFTGDSADQYYIVSGDLDRDNYLDIVYTGSTDTGLFAAYGGASGNLSAPNSLLAINQAAMAIGYIDADTLLDIIAVDGDSVYILLNQGYRDFYTLSIPLGSPAPRFKNTSNMGSDDPAAVPSVATGLLDDDYVCDVVLAPNLILYGDGFGGMSGSTVLPFTFETVNVGDFNRDGLDDLLVTSGDSAKVYTNQGVGDFVQSAAVYVGTPLLLIPPANAIMDLNYDRNIDFALVQPLADPGNQSKVIIGLGNGLGAFSQTSEILIDGLATQLVASDVNRDTKLDIVIANSTYQRLEIYYGDGLGGFSEPTTVDLEAGADATFVLATLDMDRDGNPDYVSGGLGGGDLLVAIDQQTGTTESTDEMVVTGYTSVTLMVVNPQGHVISQYYQTVAGADYWRHDVDGDGALDEESYDYNLQYGEYKVILFRRPGQPADEPVTSTIRINGTAQVQIFLDYSASMAAKAYADPEVDSIVFYYAVEETSSIRPANGMPSRGLTPTLDWSILAEAKYPLAQSFHVQVDSSYFFTGPMHDADGLTTPEFAIPTPLNDGKVYYWRFRAFDGVNYSDFSRTFALVAAKCCQNTRGNANFDPDDKANISDVAYLLAYLFGIPMGPAPLCTEEANVNGDNEEKINISDVTYLLAYLFGIPAGPAPSACP